METEPPERIWTCNETLNIWIPEKQEETVEYVRSDIVAALRAELATARNDGLEEDDGVLIFRTGPVSITVLAETATVYDTSSGKPAVKVAVGTIGAAIRAMKETV